MATQDNETRLVLERLEKEIATIKLLLEQIMASQQELIDKTKEAYAPTSYGQGDSDAVVEDGLDVGILLRLPDHLRKTMLALAKLIEGRADEVAQITGRARAIESGYLNQLMRLGYIRKIRRKHQIYFALSEGD